jgi:hypothetical protein
MLAANPAGLPHAAPHFRHMLGINFRPGKLVEKLDFAYDYTSQNRSGHRPSFPGFFPQGRPARKEHFHGQG